MPPITNNRDNNEIALDREVLFHAGSLRTSGSCVFHQAGERLRLQQRRRR